jgi:hypothetical protein
MIKLLEALLDRETARIAPLLQRELPADVEKIILEHQEVMLELREMCQHFNQTVLDRLKLPDMEAPTG